MCRSALVRHLSVFIVALSTAMGAPSPGFSQQSEEEALVNAPDHIPLQGLEWRSIGPVGQGGRVDDIAVDFVGAAQFR